MLETDFQNFLNKLILPEKLPENELTPVDITINIQ